MTKKIILALAAVAFLFCSVNIGIAAEEGNKRKGKYLYRKVYKECNKRGEVDTPRPTISPDSKTQAQWKRLFDKKEFEEFGCKKEWDKLTDQELLDIFAYLHAHAADSPSPAKCK